MTVSLLIFLPVIAALAVLFFKNEAVKHVALFFSVVELAIALYFISIFRHDASVQFSVNTPWISKLGIYFNAGIDGISMIMVLLTTLLIPIIILSTYQHTYKKASVFYALILFMQAGMLVAFTAWDGFLFYVGWEASLIPIYFICGMWGGQNRVRVTLKFFIYTFAGSLFMLASIIYMYLQTGGSTFDLTQFYNLHFDNVRQSWLFWGFFVAFAIKIPLFPFHTWQPDTYSEAPTAGSMLLAGIMLKMGIYGILRWVMPNLPVGFLTWQHVGVLLSVIGVVYASIIAFTQKDGKKLVAYSSIAHVGLIVAGILSFTMQGMQGGLIQMLSHGINVVGLFFVWDIIIRRTNTRDITQLGGIAKVAPKFATGFLIIVLGTIALPLTNGFVGEVLLLNGVYLYNDWMGIVAGLTIIFGAVYMLRMYKNVMQGETNELTATFTDLTGSEQIVMAIICVLIIVIGVYPQGIFHLSQAALDHMQFDVTNRLSPGGPMYR
jgi:NADH-quinone oxidoreductase subunit M